MINTLTEKLKKKKKGFTLIELIIVIAIIAIIAAIAIPNYTKIRNDSKTKADQQSCDTIKKITQTLLVDGTIKNGETITLHFDSNNKIDQANASTSGSVIDSYKDVKAPQLDSATLSVTVDSDGGVRVIETAASKTVVDTGTP